MGQISSLAVTLWIDTTEALVENKKATWNWIVTLIDELTNCKGHDSSRAYIMLANCWHPNQISSQQTHQVKDHDCGFILLCSGILYTLSSFLKSHDKSWD